MQFILREDKDSGYSSRTSVNANSSDATIAIAINFDSAGQKLTKSCVKKYNKLYIPVSPYGDISEKATKIVHLLNETFYGRQQILTINIAGNGINTIQGSMSQEQCDEFTYNLLFSIVNHSEFKLKIHWIRSGGQTGFDESGLKAGIRLKIDTIAYYPKGYKVRGEQGDIVQTREQVFERLGYKQKLRVYVDMDGVLCDFKGSYLKWKKEHPEITFPQSQFGFFSNLEPVSGAIDAFKKLEEIFDMRILTRPSIYNLMCYTEKADWINRYLGFHMLENMIITCDKSESNPRPSDYLIDDTIDAGQLDFKGRLIRFGSEEFPDWQSVLMHFNLK